MTEKEFNLIQLNSIKFGTTLNIRNSYFLKERQTSNIFVKQHEMSISVAWYWTTD